ncbi:MAG: MFS transporter, partial [Desulfobulbus sp.]|nr:MFS transporter [Desulfobulbus sp.]
MHPSLRLTREERSWVLYDVANSAFVLVMVTAIMPLYYKEVIVAGLPDATATANWGFANSAASLTLALLAPLLGALADYRGRKKQFFATFLVLGLVGCLALTLIQPGQGFLCLLVFVLARVGWSGANIFYDAFLVDVSTPERMDTVSARGYGYGYIGSVLPFLAVVGLLLVGGLDSGLPGREVRIGFVVVAVWWLLFSLPALVNLRQRHDLDPTAAPVADSLRRLGQTFCEVRRHRQAFLFLLAYFFYIDGVDTIITMATAYGRDLGFSVPLLIGVLLFIQVVAWPCALFYGRLAVAFSSWRLLLTGIGVYCLVTLLAFLLPSIPDQRMQVACFWLLAFLVASSMGGIQALSRSTFGRLIPAERSGEFFGLYNVVGKFAAIIGPFLMGLVGRLTGHSRWGVL